jgi:hypothetical protein
MCDQNLDIGRDGVAYCELKESADMQIALTIVTNCKRPSSIPAIEEPFDHLLQYRCSYLTIPMTCIVDVRNKIDLPQVSKV